MFTILLADKNIENISNLSHYLLDNFNASVVLETTGFDALNTYNKIKPDIMLINSNFTDKNYNEIINELTNSLDERKKCNLLLSIDSEKKDFQLTQVAKIYQIFYHPLNFSHLKDVINQYASDNNLIVKDIDYIVLCNLFLKLHFNINSKGSKYLMFAINECCKNTDLLECELKKIYALISKKFNVNINSVRPSIRSALRTFNLYKDSIEIKTLAKYFNERNNVSPRYFIDIVTNYILNQKKE